MARNQLVIWEPKIVKSPMSRSATSAIRSPYSVTAIPESEARNERIRRMRGRARVPYGMGVELGAVVTVSSYSPGDGLTDPRVTGQCVRMYEYWFSVGWVVFNVAAGLYLLWRWLRRRP